MGTLTDVSVRELRNHVSEVLHRVEAGEELRVTVDRRPVAKIVPLPVRREALPFIEYLAWRRGGGGADTALAAELSEAFPDTTDDLEP